MMQIAADAVGRWPRWARCGSSQSRSTTRSSSRSRAADEPLEGDEVVTLGEARVFLDPLAAEALADQVLGVEGHDDHYHFTFEPQAAE